MSQSERRDTSGDEGSNFDCHKRTDGKRLHVELETELKVSTPVQTTVMEQTISQNSAN